MAKRKKGSAPKPPKNSETLSPVDRQALHIYHKKRWEAADAAVKEATKHRKEIEKVAKDDLGKDAVKSIKEMIESVTPAGEAKLREEIRRRAEIFQFMAIGEQAELFDDKPPAKPAVERAHAEGVMAGMEATPRTCPYDTSLPQHDAWQEGYDVGQRSIFKIQKLQDGKAFDDEQTDIEQAAERGDGEQLGDAAATHTSSEGDAVH